MTATILSAACVLLSSLGFSRDAVELNVPSSGSIISPDATFGVVNGLEGAAYVDFVTGRTIRRFAGVKVGDISGDRRHFVTFVGSTLQYRYQASGALRFQFEFPDQIGEAKFSPDSRFLWVSANYSGGPTALYRAGDSTPVFTGIGNVEYAEDPRFAAATKPEGGATILRLAKGTSFDVPNLSTAGRVLAMSFARNEIVYHDLFDQSVRTVDFATGQTRRLVATNTGFGGFASAWYSGRQLNLIRKSNGQTAARWDRIDLSTGALTPISRFKRNPIARLSPDGSHVDIQEERLFHSTSIASRWRRYLVANGSSVAEYGGPDGEALAIAHHPTEPIAFYATISGSLKAVSVETGGQLWQSRAPRGVSTSTLAISSDGSQLAGITKYPFSTTSWVSLFEADTGSVTASFDSGIYPERVGFSQDGTELAVDGFANGQRRIRVFNPSTGVLLREYTNREFGGFLGNSKSILGNREARFWILEPNGIETPITTSSSAIYAFQVVAHPSGRVASYYSASITGDVRLSTLDLETGLVVESSHKPGTNDYAIAFGYNGEYCVAQSGLGFGAIRPRLDSPFVPIAESFDFAVAAGQKRVIWATASTISMARF